MRAGQLRQRDRLDARRFVDAAADALAGGLDGGDRHPVGVGLRDGCGSHGTQAGQNGSSIPGLAAVRTRRNSRWIRASAAWSSASKRSTIAGVVFDARASPKPSAYSTRRPSMRITSEAPGKSASACSFATRACCSPSAHAMLSSGVESASGSASSTAAGSAWRARISSRRAPA